MFFKISVLSFFAFLISCGLNDDTIELVEPNTYSFERNGETSVDFSCETVHIAMAEEIISALKDTDFTEVAINEMFAEGTGFTDTTLNVSGEIIRPLVASSFDYFHENEADAENTKDDFDGWIAEQVTDVYLNSIASITADSSTAGILTDNDGITKRYVNANGVELNQLFAKSLIGALITDQILNNYLSEAELDENNNIADNDVDILVDGTNYTAMEHKWDEAYGYLYGAEVDTAVPVLGADSFLNYYLNTVEEDIDFTGIADDIYNAFKLGRAAIVAKDYTVRDEQVEIIRENISSVIGITAVYHLQMSKIALDVDAPDYGTAFHFLSEGLGFIYSLQFTRNTDTNSPYFTKTEVDTYISDLVDQDGGFWNANTVNIIETISTEIAGEFDFTLDQVVN